MRRFCILLLILAQYSSLQQIQATPPELIGRAEALVKANPSLERQVGLSEMYRAVGRSTDALMALHAVEPTHKSDAIALRELICWRMLPVTPNNRDAFSREVERLRQVAPSSAWLRVWTMLLALHAGDRSALMTAAQEAPSPAQYPTAELLHLRMLQELGLSRQHAGLEVLASRTHEPLHALRELDRGLSREADFLREAGRTADADQLKRVRDTLRQAYDRAARTVVEKLFALNLLGQLPERDALLQRARSHPYLTDGAELTKLFHRTDALVVWVLLIEPLLRSEVDYLQSPPAIVQFAPSTFLAAHVRARRKTEQPGATVYEGETSLTLGAETITCDRLVVVQADGGGATLTGSGTVRVVGLPNLEGVTADRFTFNSETGAYTLGGTVRLTTHAGGVAKLRACTIMRSGEVRDQRSLLDDFAQAFDVERKLALLPDITAVYTDDELPDEVRYLLALSLLRPHLTWHAPYLPPRPDAQRRDLEKLQEEKRQADTGPWQEAMGGDDWLHADLPTGLRERTTKAVETFNREAAGKADRVELPTPKAFPWRLSNHGHPDVSRAAKLLDGVRGELAPRAQRWAAEVRRNNTVLTFDVPGGCIAGESASIVMDVRNADRVSFRIYRVRKPAELHTVLARIGTDFVFHDHGLRHGDRLQHLLERRAEMKVMHDVSRVVSHDDDSAQPSLDPNNLVHRWEVDPDELKRIPETGRRDHRQYEQGHEYRRDDGGYFDDECRQFQARLDRRYQPERWATSSWRCGCIVEVPGKAVTESGAYIVVAEANGQSAFVPLIVDPLSLTLRRCRDGVLALVCDADGRQPVAGAEVTAHRQHGNAVTDAAGVAFARVFAAGDRAIVADKDGRFAVGGFGRVFEGLYLSSWERASRHEWIDEPERLAADERRQAHVYADRHVLAVYSDRPTYRPGQPVQFKLIVRRLKADPKPGEILEEFRADEFDRATRLELPDPALRVKYTVVDPRGRDVASGELTLNDHGTAADALELPAEAVVGNYSLRVRLGEVDRIAPDAFTVRYYRRPNFELIASGVPRTWKPSERLSVRLEGRYLFGKPVVGGRVELTLVRSEGGRPLTETRGELDAEGKASLELEPPSRLAGGKYIVVGRLFDSSDRIATTTQPLEVEGIAARGDLAKLPRFVQADRVLSLPTDAEVQAVTFDGVRHAFKSEKGVAVIRLPLPGWYRLTSGDAETVVYAYGGESLPELQPPETWGEWPGWVDLSHYRSEDEPLPVDSSRSESRILALFDRQQAQVGNRVRMLIHVPYRKAHVLFTLESYTILDYHRTEIADGPYAVIELPITRRHLPNVYVQARIITGESRTPEREPGREGKQQARKLREEWDDSEDPHWCRIDVTDPARPRGEERLRVQVEPERTDYRPGDEVGVRVRVTDLAGKPQAAEVSLAAVDDSVFAFGEDRLDELAGVLGDPHPPQRFLRKAWRSSLGSRWRTVNQVQLVELLKQQEMAMAKMAEALQGGAEHGSHDLNSLLERHPQRTPLSWLSGELPMGSLPLGRLRSDFRETAAWLPQLRTGADGDVHARFRLPDSLTRYRLSAVALTRDTEIGVGRGSIRASLPLAVQVFLPRFVVERDRLLAVGLIHNTDTQERNCTVTWDVRGAKVDGLADGFATRIDDWKVDAGQGRGRLTVPAGGSVRVGLWLSFDRPGSTTVVFRCGDARDSDAEERTLTVQPLGRPREVVLQGSFKERTGVKLPDGFVASEVRLVLARGDLARALEGVGGLVEYPYGCVEQTMSRFLPAVAVQEATRHAPVGLSPEIARRLPDVLAKGLTRLYDFQHADGGWGWWQHDATDDRMTCYVVQGLARCRTAGVAVDDRVLARGIDYLRVKLRDGKLSESLIASAHLAVALAGQADTQKLARAAETMNSRSAELRAQLALACRTAGLREAGERLWRSITNWDPQTTELMALQLTLELEFGAPLNTVFQTAGRLLAARRGLGWENTQATAYAVTALARVMIYARDSKPPRSVRVTAAGKAILDITDPLELQKLVQRVRRAGDGLPNAAEFVLTCDGGEVVHYTLEASGVQRQDVLGPEGREVRVTRQLETLEGKPFVGRWKVGDVVAVRLTVDLDEAREYLLLEERRPAGCEFADEQFLTPPGLQPAHVEFRDDRVCAFFGKLPAGRHEFVYYLRAETAGVSHVLPGCVYPMYADHLRGETGSLRLEILPREKE